ERLGMVHGISPSVEWWNDQIDGWMFSTLWNPHYVASLTAALMGFLILSRGDNDARSRVQGAVLAGLAFATSIGSGIFVALVFGVFLVIWTLNLGFQKRLADSLTFSGAGLTTVVAAAPFLITMLSGSDAVGGSAPKPTLELGMRTFGLSDL